MPSKARKVAEARREERRTVVAANLLAGLTYRQMAEAIGCSLGTIAGDVAVVLQRWSAEQVGSVDQKRQLEAQRLDMALNAIWAKVLEGQEGAIDRLLRISERRAKLFGLDAPTKVAPTLPDGTTPYDVTEHVTDAFCTEVATILAQYGQLHSNGSHGADEPAGDGV